MSSLLFALKYRIASISGQRYIFETAFSNDHYFVNSMHNCHRCAWILMSMNLKRAKDLSKSLDKITSRLWLLF